MRGLLLNNLQILFLQKLNSRALIGLGLWSMRVIIDHENDAICNASRALLVVTISQQKIKQIPLKIFSVIVKHESTRLFQGLHSYSP